MLGFLLGILMTANGASMIEETLPYHEYVVRECRKSKIDPTRTICVDKGFRCPGCKKYQEPGLEHGHATVCIKCNLYMALYGNALICRKWLEEKHGTSLSDAEKPTYPVE